MMWATSSTRHTRWSVRLRSGSFRHDKCADLIGVMMKRQDEEPIKAKSQVRRPLGRASSRGQGRASGQAAAELRETDDRFRLLFEHSPDAIFLLDPHDALGEWPIVDCNEVACRMNGYARDELLGQSVDILHGGAAVSDDRADYFDRLRREGTLHLEA